jgi:F-type H+/Na+-transporting ATPase subunit alpha
VGSTLKLDLAQYRELAAFSQFGSDLDKVTLQQLNRGVRLTELLKQPQFQPLSVEKQVVILFAGVNGLLDDVEVSDLRAFEDGFYPYLEASAPAILTDIATKKALDDDLKKRLTDAVNDYKASFLADLKDKKQAADKQSAAPQTNAAPAMAGSK